MDLVLFDLDGTLIDSGDIIIGAQERTAALHGLPFPGREAGLAVVGLSLDIALEELFGRSVPAAALSATYKQVFGEMRGAPGFDEPMFGGVPEMLADLGRRPATALGIATGKTQRGVAFVSSLHGWNGMFRTIQTADDAPSKPHPGMIQQGIAAVGSTPSRTVMIGDSVHDMRMAKAAGVTAIAVAWGFQPVPALLEAGADLVARGAADLPRLIEEALTRPA
jgi:phosphoglycolate phosphatase